MIVKNVNKTVQNVIQNVLKSTTYFTVSNLVGSKLNVSDTKSIKPRLYA